MINYINGDATNPIIKPAIIAHVCNNRGGWGRGFVLALSAKWKQPEQQYKNITKFLMGYVQYVKVENDITVANMIAQDGYVNSSNPIAIRYKALEACLESVNNYALVHKCSIHMPRIGAGLAGGNWVEIEQIITKICTQNVYVYTLLK